MRNFSFSFLFKSLFEKALSGRSLAHLILAALSLYPPGIKESRKRLFLGDVPYGRFCLAMYPSADFAASGASWMFWWFWAGFSLAGTFGVGIWPPGLDLGPPKLESCLRWPPALKSELLLLPGALCVLLYGGGLSAYQPLYPLSARLLINTVSSHARRSIPHKEIPHDKSQRQTNTCTNKQTNERTGEKTTKQTSNERTTEPTSRLIKQSSNKPTNKQASTSKQQANNQASKQLHERTNERTS